MVKTVAERARRATECRPGARSWQHHPAGAQPHFTRQLCSASDCAEMRDKRQGHEARACIGNACLQAPAAGRASSNPWRRSRGQSPAAKRSAGWVPCAAAATAVAAGYDAGVCPAVALRQHDRPPCAERPLHVRRGVPRMQRRRRRRRPLLLLRRRDLGRQRPHKELAPAHRAHLQQGSRRKGGCQAHGGHSAGRRAAHRQSMPPARPRKHPAQASGQNSQRPSSFLPPQRAPVCLSWRTIDC